MEIIYLIMDGMAWAQEQHLEVDLAKNLQEAAIKLQVAGELNMAVG